MATQPQLADLRTPATLPARILRASSAALVVASWISAGAFGLYIFAFYLGAIPAGRLEQWNDNLSGVYDRNNLAAFLAMTAHLATGAVLLLLGPVQLIAAIRNRWPQLHRWLGRLYVLTAAAAGAGGLAFIAAKGTIGGVVMNVGFGLYGALMVLAAVQTYRHARSGNYSVHRVWAVRLFALAIGSWLYRMDYGFWLLAMHRIGHQEDFRGPFDVVMAFFFYVPNLAIAEVYLRSRPRKGHPVRQLAGATVLAVATLIVAIGSYYFLRFYWGPAIWHAIAG